MNKDANPYTAPSQDEDSSTSSKTSYGFRWYLFCIAVLVFCGAVIAYLARFEVAPIGFRLEDQGRPAPPSFRMMKRVMVFLGADWEYWLPSLLVPVSILDRVAARFGQDRLVTFRKVTSILIAITGICVTLWVFWLLLESRKAAG